MVNYLKVKNEFNQKLNELKKETHPSVYANDLNEIVLYQKLLELEEQIKMLKEKSITEEV
jgi:hypothetical protein